MYIRTKDGVYEVVGFDEECIIPSTLIKVKKDCCIERITHCCKDDIIKQADTIEELCDEFVMTHYFPETNYTKREVLKEDKDLMIKAVRLKKQHNKDKDLKNEFNIYGAIWTSKGLIYVAKMDSEGKLVLI